MALALAMAMAMAGMEINRLGTFNAVAIFFSKPVVETRSKL